MTTVASSKDALAQAQEVQMEKAVEDFRRELAGDAPSALTSRCSITCASIITAR